ncbi:MAG: hypothetical protein H6684_13325 [Deltaproteobacteria bacterium]|nr:hypothetical protein [bacterium]MCB9479893.1 hypothetical protein [Deltaproteobacteria bacterium]MCB9489708.1 hypothetical protein [Deltaproteobacteria bacterium]
MSGTDIIRAYAPPAVAVAVASSFDATRNPQRRLFAPTVPAVAEEPRPMAKRSTTARYIPNPQYIADDGADLALRRRLPPGALSYGEVDRITRGYRERGILLDVTA